MFRNNIATESSRELGSAQDTLRSTDSNPAPANRKDSSSSSQVDKADSSSHATGTGSNIAETTIPTVVSPLTPNPTYETHVRTDELPKNEAQSPSDGHGIPDASQLPQLSPLMPVRRPSQSKPDIQTQSTIISPIPASSVIPQELPSQYPQHVPTAQIPPSRAGGDISASFPGTPRMPHQHLISDPSQVFPSPAPQQNVTPLRQSADTPSMHYGTPSQPNRPQSAVAPQLYSSSPARPIVPQSAPPQFYSLPNTPTSQAQLFYVGLPQGFIPQRFFPYSVPPQFYSLPNAPTPQAQSIYVGMPQRFFPYSASPHSYSLPSALTPQTHTSHAGTPQQFVPQSVHQSYSIPNASTAIPQAQSTHLGLPQGVVPQSTSPYFYSLPNTPTPQAQSVHVGTPQPFMSQNPAPRYGHIPSPQPFPNVPYLPVIRRADPFVANDPFQVSYGYDEVDRPSDILTYDDIPTPGSTPRLKLSSLTNSPYGSLSGRPTSGEIPPLSLDAYPYTHSSAQQRTHPPSNVPAPQISPSRPSWVPEPPNQHQMSGGDDASEKDDTSGTPSSVSKQSVRFPTPVFPESQMPSTQHSVIIESKSDGTLSNSHESQTGPDESSSRPYIPPYPQHSKYQYPELPESIFSRFTRFFRWLYHTQSLGSPQHSTATSPPIKPNTNWGEHKFMKVAIKFVWVTLPMQMYLYVLLRLPSLYFSRVAQIFEEAGMALDDMKKMALEMASQGLNHEAARRIASEPSSVSPAYKRLASTWEFFIDSVMREWKTFNIISVLLLTAILTILQIQGAAEDPLTRYTALFSLICALISLLFGCMYIVRFGSMRKPYKAAEWALEAKKTKTLIWWNVWVLLAMPAIWSTWSILLYIACIMSFVWRSGATSTTPEISDTGLLAVRIVITVVLVLGMIYAFLIMTTFRRYGAAMDKKWKRRVDSWINKKKARKQRSFVQPALGHPPYPPTPHAYPDGSAMYQVPTYSSSPYYQRDAQSRYAWDMHGPAYSSDAYVPLPEPHWTLTGAPDSPSFSDATDDHVWDAYTPAYAPDSYLMPTEPYFTKATNLFNSAWSTGDVTQANTNFNAGYIPSPKLISSPLPPKVFIPSPEKTPPELVPEKPHFAAPPPSLPPTSSTTIDPPSNNKAIGSSSELKNKVGGDGDVLENKNRVRFQSPLIHVDNKVPATPRGSSDSGSCPSGDLEYV